MNTLFAATTALVSVASVAFAGPLPAREPDPSHYGLDANQKFLCDYGGRHFKIRECAAVSTTPQIETVLYSFCSQKNCEDGANPEASLIDVSGTLYGTTFYGGSSSTSSCCSSCSGTHACSGTVFSLNPNTGAHAVLYAFGNGVSTGSEPKAGLIDVAGTLYGMAEKADRRLICCGNVF
jgi:hypothetical protein